MTKYGRPALVVPASRTRAMGLLDYCRPALERRGLNV
jgi:hypothetical protein